MIFRKGGRQTSKHFYYNGKRVDIENKFNYLGIVFTPGGSFSEAQTTLSGQALKGFFKMIKYLHKFIDLSVSHRLNLFDRLIMPILNYGSEVWGFSSGMSIERVHMQFCKQTIGVKR